MTRLLLKITSANANARLCGSCGGKCCQRLPGSVLPSDLAEDAVGIARRVQDLLATGRYAIDAYENWDKAGPRDMEPKKQYFLRPAVQGYEGQVLDLSWGGACTFHSSTGCELDEATRPGECKMLIPANDKRCGFGDTGWTGRPSVAAAWAPYHDMLEDLLQ